jgi:phospholipid-translocating ATPase
MGKEGRQAARCSDYAFTKFEFLLRLLLVHGHFGYHRIAYTVQYFFYKNIVFILPVLFFGPDTLFSAQTLYDRYFVHPSFPLSRSWLMMVYNIFFTSWPVLTFGVLEQVCALLCVLCQDLDEASLIDNPAVYQSITRNRALSLREFLLWSLTGVFQVPPPFFCFF